MTFTSFNPIQLPQVENNSGNNQLTIKQGQVFHGTIKKLYPDQTAEVQIGNHKMIAKLEAPLKAGDSYFLQVKSVTPQIELSLVSNTTGSLSTQAQINQLIESMNLPKSQEVQQLLNFFIKNEIPIVKEQLLDAIQWIKNLPQGVQKQEAFLALQKMINDKLPFQQNVFHALIFGAKTSGILQDIEAFSLAMEKDMSLPNEVKTTISNLLQKIATPMEGEIGGEVLKRAIQTLQNKNMNTETRLAMLNLLKDANILPKHATLENWQTTSFNQIAQQPNTLSQETNQINQQPNQISQQTDQLGQYASQIVQKLFTANGANIEQTIENVKNWVQNQPLTQDQKSALLNLLNHFQNGVKDRTSIEQFARMFHEKLIDVYLENGNNQLFSTDKNGITMKEQLLSLLKHTNGHEELHAHFLDLVRQSNDKSHVAIQNSLTQSEQLVQSTFDGKAVHFALKTILKSFGISYEAGLQNLDVEVVSNSLKPQLLSLMQNSEISQNVKDSAEVLLARLNGMQLASGEQNHQYQLIMQVPLQFFGKKMDATVQWNGRMMEDGKIDANFARILFYLNMETLEETVIDMQVQNRIVTIQVYNENTNLEHFADPLIKTLREGLGKLNYHLSGIFFKQFQKPEQKENKKKEAVEHSGVDIRI